VGIITTLVGNATSDAETRFTQSGLAVASFSLAINDRKFNKQTQDWEDGEAQFVRVNVWRDMAEHVGSSVKKGQRIIATGKIAMSEFTTRDGDVRHSLEMQADEVGISLRYGTAEYTKAAPKGQGNRAPAAAPADEPWSPSAPVAGGVPAYDETPF